MKEVEIKYFVNGIQTDRELIDWENSIGVRLIDNNAHVLFPYYTNTLSYTENPNLDPLVTKELSSLADLVRKTGVLPVEIGVKHNKYKAPLDIVQTKQFPKALQALALATAFGNKKYKATDTDFLNFKRVEGGSQNYFDASARHNTERDEVDEDSGLLHIIHAVWNMLAGLELYFEENNIDIKEFSKKYLESLHNSK